MGGAIRSSDSTSTGSLVYVLNSVRIGNALPSLKGSALSNKLTSGLMRSEISHNDL